MDGYQIGKDIQAILTRVERLEAVLMARQSRTGGEFSGCGKFHRFLGGVGGTTGILLTPQPQLRPKEYGEGLDKALPLTADWVGDRSAGTRRSPDNQQEFRFMAFTQNNTNPFNDRSGVWRYFWSMVDKAGSENYCSPDDRGSNIPAPGDGTGAAWYFGCYDVTTGYGNWAHFFTGLRYPNGSCCASRLTWNDGTNPPDAGGDRSFYFPFDPSYKVTIRCADDDNLGGTFQFLGVS